MIRVRNTCFRGWLNQSIILPYVFISVLVFTNYNIDLNPSVMLYIYKGQIRQKMEYCCHVWSVAVQSSLSSLELKFIDAVLLEKTFCTLQPLFTQTQRCKLTLLFHYSHGKCSNEVCSLVPPIQIFTARTHNATFTDSNHHRFLLVPDIWRKFHSFFTRVL